MVEEVEERIRKVDRAKSDWIAVSKDEWVDRCFRRYLACGITNEHKARLWADARWHLIGGDLSKSPEDAADEDLASW